MSKIRDLVSRIVLGAAVIDIPVIALSTVVKFPASWKWETRAAKFVIKQGVVKTLLTVVDYNKPDKKQKTPAHIQRRDLKQDYKLTKYLPQTRSQNYNHFSNYLTYS